MISYELAKQLEDAGFPSQYVKADGLTYDLQECKNIGIPFIAPTLSELIDACGDKFGVLNCFYRGDDEIKSLEQLKKENPNTRFHGHTQTQEGWHCSGDGGEIHITGCKTPEEAVAKLCLELNKK